MTRIESQEACDNIISEKEKQLLGVLEVNWNGRAIKAVYADADNKLNQLFASRNRHRLSPKQTQQLQSLKQIVGKDLDKLGCVARIVHRHQQSIFQQLKALAETKPHHHHHRHRRRGWIIAAIVVAVVVVAVVFGPAAGGGAAAAGGAGAASQKKNKDKESKKKEPSSPPPPPPKVTAAAPAPTAVAKAQQPTVNPTQPQPKPAAPAPIQSRPQALARTLNPPFQPRKMPEVKAPNPPSQPQQPIAKPIQPQPLPAAINQAVQKALSTASNPPPQAPIAALKPAAQIAQAMPPVINQTLPTKPALPKAGGLAPSVDTLFPSQVNQPIPAVYNLQTQAKSQVNSAVSPTQMVPTYIPKPGPLVDPLATPSPHDVSKHLLEKQPSSSNLSNLPPWVPPLTTPPSKIVTGSGDALPKGIPQPNAEKMGAPFAVKQDAIQNPPVRNNAVNNQTPPASNLASLASTTNKSKIRPVAWSKGVPIWQKGDPRPPEGMTYVAICARKGGIFLNDPTKEGMIRAQEETGGHAWLEFVDSKGNQSSLSTHRDKDPVCRKDYTDYQHDHDTIRINYLIPNATADLVKKAAVDHASEKYNLFFHNCVHTTHAGATAAGLDEFFKEIRPNYSSEEGPAFVKENLTLPSAVHSLIEKKINELQRTNHPYITPPPEPDSEKKGNFEDKKAIPDNIKSKVNP